MTQNTPDNISNSDNEKPELAGQEQKKDTRFKKGQSGNPKGRKKGSRNKITKAYLNALRKDFLEHGESTLKKVREKDPKAYMKLVADLVPKEVDLDPQGNGDVSLYIVKSFDAVPEASDDEK